MKFLWNSLWSVYEIVRGSCIISFWFLFVSLFHLILLVLAWKRLFEYGKYHHVFTDMWELGISLNIGASIFWYVVKVMTAINYYDQMLNVCMMNVGRYPNNGAIFFMELVEGILMLLQEVKDVPFTRQFWVDINWANWIAI